MRPTPFRLPIKKFLEEEDPKEIIPDLIKSLKYLKKDNNVNLNEFISSGDFSGTDKSEISDYEEKGEDDKVENLLYSSFESYLKKEHNPKYTHLFDSVFKITIENVPDEKTGELNTICGTGFLIKIPIDKGKHRLMNGFLTNNHVLNLLVHNPCLYNPIWLEFESLSKKYKFSIYTVNRFIWSS